MTSVYEAVSAAGDIDVWDTTYAVDGITVSVPERTQTWRGRTVIRIMKEIPVVNRGYALLDCDIARFVREHYAALRRITSEGDLMTMGDEDTDADMTAGINAVNDLLSGTFDEAGYRRIYGLLWPKEAEE